jgi:hypothetical protein
MLAVKFCNQAKSSVCMANPGIHRTKLHVMKDQIIQGLATHSCNDNALPPALLESQSSLTRVTGANLGILE